MFYITTPAIPGYEHVWVHLDKPWVTFSLAGCKEGRVGLAAGPGDSNTDISLHYEVILRSDPQIPSVIRDTRTLEVRTENITDGLLDCTQLRSFWIAWDDHSLSVGRGADKGGDTFLDMFFDEENYYPTRAITVSSGYDSTATWGIYKDEGISL